MPRSHPLAVAAPPRVALAEHPVPHAPDDEVAARQTGPTGLVWVEPSTHEAYPVSFEAYRRKREAEERPLQTLGAHIDRFLWVRRGASPSGAAEVVLMVRPDTPPRIRRILAEVLPQIRHGRPAAAAIRTVSRRFGLRQTRARRWLASSIDYRVQPLADEIGPIEVGCYGKSMPAMELA